VRQAPARMHVGGDLTTVVLSRTFSFAFGSAVYSIRCRLDVVYISMWVKQFMAHWQFAGDLIEDPLKS
jgi:hypothetical protein